MESSRMACVAVCTVFVMVLLASTGHGAKLNIGLEEGPHCSEYAVVSCMASDIDSSAREVEIIQILKEKSNSKKMLAYIYPTQNNIIYTKEKHEFMGTGKIDKSAQDSFLALTFSSPKAEDEGEYSCEVYYTDAAGVQQHTVSTGTLRLTKKPEQIKPEVSKKDLEDLQEQIRLLKSNDIETKRKLQEQKKANDDLKELVEKEKPEPVKPEVGKKDLEDLQEQIKLVKLTVNTNDIETKQKLQEQEKANDDFNNLISRMTNQYNYQLDTVLRKGYVTKDTMDKALDQLETSLGGSSNQEMAELNATLTEVKDDLQKKLEEFDVEQDADLAKHVDTFEGIVKDLVEKATVSQIDDRVGSTETIVSKLAEKYNYLQDKVSVLEFLVQAPAAPETTPGPTKDPVADVMVKLADLEQQSQNQTQQISFLLDKDFKAFKEINDLANVTTHLNKAVGGLTLGATESQSNMTAFCASLLNSLTAVVKKKIIFDSVQLNRGQGYDPQTGRFTAPRSGIYAFQLAVMFRIQYEWTDIQMQKNGNLLARLTSKNTDHEDLASTSVVTSLDAGDKVENIITYNTKDQSKPTELVNLQFSNFCGFFLQPL